MKTYTVQLAFKCSYVATVQVEADDVNEACQRALASDCDSFDFQPADDASDTFVQAVGEGASAFDSGDSALPVPAQYSEDNGPVRRAFKDCDTWGEENPA